KEAYGRIIHLQPMKWKNDWPMMGEDINGDWTGQPVMSHKKPNVGKTYPITTPADSDEFTGNDIGLQWQWHANPKATWAFANPSKGRLRLYAHQVPDNSKNLWDAPNLLLQKFPAEEFTATTHLTFHPNANLENEKTGLIVMGMTYAYIALESKKDGIYLKYAVNDNAEKGNAEKERVIKKLNGNSITLRVSLDKNEMCTFSYSENGKDFSKVDEAFKALPGKWIGAKVGIFAIQEEKTNDSGYADYDW